MEKYELYFKDIFLGNLMINEGKYYFKPIRSQSGKRRNGTDCRNIKGNPWFYRSHSFL